MRSPMSAASVTIRSGSSLSPRPRTVVMFELRRVARLRASAKNMTRSSWEHAGSREVTVTREEEQGADWRWQRWTSPHLPLPTRSTNFNMLRSTAGTSSIGLLVHVSPDPVIDRLLTEVLLEPEPAVSLGGLPDVRLVLPSLLLPSLRWAGATSRASRSAEEREDLSTSSSSLPCCLLRLLLRPPSTGGRTCWGRL